VGTLGTALTDRHVAQLRSAVKEAVLVFDGDDAGGKAAERSIGLFLDAGVRVRIATLPALEDPDSFLRSHTSEEFLGCVRNAQTFPAFLLGRAQKNLELQTAGGRGDFVERIAPLLRKVTNEVERWGHLVFMAEKLAVPLRSLERQLFPQTDSHRGPARKRQAETLPARPGTKRYPEEYDLVCLLYHRPELLTKVDSQTTSADFMDADLGGLYSLLLQLAPHDVEEHWFHRLNGKATDEQVELLSRMAMEPLPPASVGDVQAMKDYFERMRQRRRGFRLGQVAQQLRNEHDESEQRRLLEATDQLAKKRQPAALLGSGSLGGSN
jgi:DNA primase